MYTAKNRYFLKYTYSKLDSYGYGEKLERVRKALYKLFEEYSNKGASTIMASCFSNVRQPPSIIRREREKLSTYDVSCFLINPLSFFFVKLHTHTHTHTYIYILFSESFIWSFDRILKNFIAKKLTILENLNFIFI